MVKFAELQKYVRSIESVKIFNDDNIILGALEEVQNLIEITVKDAPLICHIYLIATNIDASDSHTSECLNNMFDYFIQHNEKMTAISRIACCMLAGIPNIE